MLDSARAPRKQTGDRNPATGGIFSGVSHGNGPLKLPANQRAAIGAELANLKRGSNRFERKEHDENIEGSNDPSINETSISEVAAMMGVGTATIKRAKTEMRRKQGSRYSAPSRYRRTTKQYTRPCLRYHCATYPPCQYRTMKPTSFRFDQDTLDRIRTLARPGESQASVIQRALIALEGQPQPLTPEMLSLRLADLEGRVSALESSANVVQSTAGQTGDARHYTQAERAVAILLDQQGKRPVEIRRALLERFGRAPSPRSIRRQLNAWQADLAVTA